MRRLRQSTRSPRRHGSHRPQWPPNQPTPTRVPSAQPMTSLPTASITPAISCPGTIGYGIEGNSPSLTIESLWQTPHACTLTRTSPGWGCGNSRSTNSKGPFFSLSWTTRIFGITAPVYWIDDWHWFPVRIVDVHRNLSNTIEQYSIIRQRYDSVIGTTVPAWAGTRRIAIATGEHYARKRQERFGEWV